MSDVHPNTLRVIAAARDAGLEITTRRFPEGTKTAAAAATAIGVTVGQIVKSLVFGVDNEIVMALVSGSNQLDEKKLALAAGGAKCARVDADAVREATGYPMVACLPLVTAHSCACLLIRTCCSTTRCGPQREHGTTTLVPHLRTLFVLPVE
jgi:prolyl-tRNA editing enzyme YbaK/EbsC (Cys-tRNA(Pro) deacylase)